MTQAAGATSGAASTPSAQSDAFNNLDLEVFLKLMITELQNQDPLNPLENDQLLAQISQIREVGATDRLTETLDAVLIGQNISSATNLIGADVTALSDQGERVSGNVRRVTIDKGKPTLDLAVDVGASAPPTEGAVESGQYLYNVVWEDAGGELFGVQVSADTGKFASYSGAIGLQNLPETSSDKLVFRTDRTGKGDMRLVGSLRGDASSMVDTLADADRGDQTLDTPPQLVNFARKISVSLKNVAEINPPQ